MNKRKQLLQEICLEVRQIHQLLTHQLDQQTIAQLLPNCHHRSSPLVQGDFVEIYAQTIVFTYLYTSPKHPVAFQKTLQDMGLPAIPLKVYSLVLEQLDKRSLLQLSINYCAHHHIQIIDLYDYFLYEYEPTVRSNQGVFYTPTAICNYLAHCSHRLLNDKFYLSNGLADTQPWSYVTGKTKQSRPNHIPASQPFVSILDPAAGTGIFLESCIRIIYSQLMTQWQALPPKEQQEKWRQYVVGAGEFAGKSLLSRLYAIEIMTVPWFLCLLRGIRVLAELGITVKAQDLHFYQAESLSFTASLSPKLGHFTVIIGNPPFVRQKRGQHTEEQYQLISQILPPAMDLGYGKQLANVYNVYVYFMIWAINQITKPGHLGIVSLVTASSFIKGLGFIGLRQKIIEKNLSMWLTDLQGDRYGTIKTDNVFDILTPICCFSMLNDNSSSSNIVYVEIPGKKAEKLNFCAQSTDYQKIPWQQCHPKPPLLRFKPITDNAYEGWPEVSHIFPWQSSGCKIGRTWPIAESYELLQKRWQKLVALQGRKKRKQYLKESSSGKSIDSKPTPLGSLPTASSTIAQTSSTDPPPPIVPYSWRSCDRHWLLADDRLIDRCRPQLWQAHGRKQLYFTTMFRTTLGFGPAAMVTQHIPDQNYFCGRNGKDIFPMYLDAEGQQLNIHEGITTKLQEIYGTLLNGEDVFYYVYAILSAPKYSQQFFQQLRTPGPRVPITYQRDLFTEGARLGRQLVEYQKQAHSPELALTKGSAQLEKPLRRLPADFHYAESEQRLYIGTGCIKAVSAAVYGYSVSGHKVVHSYLRYRLKVRGGKKSSPLDDLRPKNWSNTQSNELLRLLWTIERIIAQQPILDRFLDKVLQQPMVTTEQLT